MTPTAHFASACGADSPLDLVVEGADGQVLSRGRRTQPFALLGRSPTCDLLLPHRSVGSKHALLQVVGGRVFAADLGSRTGVRWSDGWKPFGWLTPGEPVRVGPFRVSLVGPVSERPKEFGPAFHPLAAGPDVPVGLPSVTIELRTARPPRTRWRLTRVLTFAGRVDGCKVRLDPEGVSQFHAAFVLTPGAAWVVDLLGRGGVKVNGDPARFARLFHGDALTVGRHVLGVIGPAMKRPPAAVPEEAEVLLEVARQQ